MQSRFPNPFRFLWHNRDTLLLAFLLSVAVWASAVIASDPNTDALIENGVPLEVVGFDESLIMISTLQKTVQVEIRAPESLLEEINTNKELVQATIDFTNVGKGEHTLPVNVTLGVSPAQILSVEPETITVLVEEEISVEMPVDLNLVGEPALGFRVEKIELGPDTVLITGPESRVALVTNVVGNLSITSIRDDFSTVTNLTAVDENGRQISGVTLSPTQTDVFLQVIQASGYRDVAVRVDTVGQPASGYRVINISVEPPTVTVFSATPGQVADISGVVSTQPLDLTDRTEGVDTRLGLVLPEGVTMVGDDQTVQVRIGIAAIETSISLNVPIAVSEIGTGLTADLSPATVDVILTGPLRVVESLTPEDVIVFISLSGLDIGSYLVEPQFDVLVELVTVESINPDTIEVIITESINGEELDATFTPTPTTSP